MQYVAVVGSRRFNDYAFMKKVLDALKNKIGAFIVVSGAAPGADSLAVRWAKENGLRYIEHPAAWSDLDAPGAIVRQRSDGTWYNRKAGFDRNAIIVRQSDMVIAFTPPDQPTPGTADTIKQARAVGKKVYVVWPGHKFVEY